jgi:hypothetical protein
VSRTKRALIGAVLLLTSFALMGSGGSAGRSSSESWSGQHVVAVAPDINAIMATGGCRPGTPGG